MKNYYVALSGAFVLLFLFACKKPEASFDLMKYEYSAGDLLEIDNESLRGKVFQWDIVSESGVLVQSAKEKNPLIYLDLMLANGMYSLRLVARSKNGNRATIDEKSFKVKTNRGSLQVISQNAADNEYEVYVDNQLIGKSQSYPGTFLASIPVGLRTIKVVNSNKVVTESATFTTNGLVTVNF